MSHKQPRPVSASQGQSTSTNGQASRPVPLSSRPVPLRQGTQPVLPTARKGAAQGQGDQDEPLVMADLVKRAPPWLISGVVHMLVLIVLGLCYMASAPQEQVFIESIPNPWADEYGDPLGTDQYDFKSLSDSKVLSISDMAPVDDPFSAPGKVEITQGSGLGAFAGSDVVAPGIGNNLKGREIGSRDANLVKYGGTKITEKGVQMALAWLKKKQSSDGGWSLSGPFESGGVRPEERNAATAMAVLAFQGTGNTHKRGKYMNEVLKGKDFLLSRQQENGVWRSDTGHHRMYVHAQCTIAICELYAMTGDPSLQEPADKAIKHCIAAQTALGGWRYNPADQDADVSVTGWVLMALQSAKMGKIEVPERTFERVGKFLDRCTDDGVRYGYMSKDDDLTPAMTAEALLCREWLGWPRSDPRLRQGIDHLVHADNLPTWDRWDDIKGRGRDAYYWYYATQAIHHYGGSQWDQWNKVIRELLPKHQIKEGSEAGSWDPAGDKWGQFGGRLYVTCLNTYILEVYYRHLPLYDMK